MSQKLTGDRWTDAWRDRHVVLPKEIAKLVPKTHLMSESEWRGLGVQQSHGWVHYLIHEPEPHILLFKRAIQNPPSQEEQFRAEQEQDGH